KLRKRLRDRTRALDRDYGHLQSGNRERHRDAVIAAGVEDPVMQWRRLDADGVGECLRAPAERVDAIRDDRHPVALLLSGMPDAGELGRLGRLRRDDSE